MRILVLGLALLITAGCDGGGGDDNNDTSDNDNCPEGLSQARAAGATVTGYVQNGIGLALVFDQFATLPSGQPAACVSSDLLLAQWVLSNDSGPVAVLRQSVTTQGSQPIDGSTGSLTFEVIGVETVQANEWQSGTWFTETDGGTLTSVVNANATTGAGGTYTLNAAFEATP